MNRCDQPGWEPVVIPDGRRGLWVRLVESLELCAGREGDDDYLRLDIGQVFTRQDLHTLYELMETVQMSVELQACEDHCASCPRTKYLQTLTYLERVRQWAEHRLWKMKWVWLWDRVGWRIWQALQRKP